MPMSTKLSQTYGLAFLFVISWPQIKGFGCPTPTTKDESRLSCCPTVETPVAIINPNPERSQVPVVQGRLADDVNLDTLKLVQIFFRHGDRSPLFDFPNNPVNITETWPLGLGQLTAKGKGQAHELGRFLRKRYSGFIKNEFDPKEVYVQSSDFDRTIMSALGVLSGMYLPTGKFWNPSINWDPVPLRTIPCHLDNKLSFASPCPAYKAEFNEIAKKGEGKIFDDKNKLYYDFIAKKTGLSNITFTTISELFDTLYIQHLNGFPLPDWAARPFAGEQPFLMRRSAQYVFSMLTATNKSMKLRGGPIFREILRNIQTYRTKLNDPNGPGNVPRRMILYSAHDTTVSTLLQTLGVYEPQLVPYSAAVIIELHSSANELPTKPINKCSKSKSREEDYYIKVLYRNCSTTPPIELFIPNCGSNAVKVTETEQLCRLPDLRKLKRHLLEGNWESECHRGHGSSQCPCQDISENWSCPDSNQKEMVSFFDKHLSLCRSLFVDPISDVLTPLTSTSSEKDGSWMCKLKNLIPDFGCGSHNVLPKLEHANNDDDIGCK